MISLLLFSIIFYGYSGLKNLFLLIFSTLINYYSARVMMKNQSGRKAIYISSLALNLIVLFVCKYSVFTIRNISLLFEQNLNGSIFNKIVLPLGISFYTFQQISYITDVYRGKVNTYSLLEYALFVSFYAQLVAGPIALHDEMIPQFTSEDSAVDWEWIYDGFCIFSIGMAKKVLLADKLSIIVNYGYSSICELSSIDAWIVMLSYSLQIYFDFSGYCDMAYGIGKMFHFELPVNFDSPYRATSIVDFWGRWHITLNRFFKNYVYIPMGGNKKGKVIQYRNILIVFLLSGVWHGANWTFIVWEFCMEY